MGNLSDEVGRQLPPLLIVAAGDPNQAGLVGVEWQPIDLTVGDRVIYSKYAGNEVKLEDQEYLILAEKDVLAVIES